MNLQSVQCATEHARRVIPSCHTHITSSSHIPPRSGGSETLVWLGTPYRPLHSITGAGLNRAFLKIPAPPRGVMQTRQDGVL